MKRAYLKRWTWRLTAAAVLAVAGFGLNCGGATGPGAPTPEPLSREERAREREAAQVYRRAEDAFDEANHAVADSLASLLIDEYRATRWYGAGLLLSARLALELNEPELARAQASRYLRLFRASDPQRSGGLVVVARVLHLEGRALEAADSLLATALDLGDAREEAAQLARQVVSELGLGEIDTVTARWSAGHPLRSVFEVERASLLLASGHSEEGREAAERAIEMDPLEPETNRARSIASGEVETEQWRPIIGAILPLSGPLAVYGRMAEEGIRLAVKEYNERHFDAVTLIVRDDADQYDRAGDLVRELERLGAVAIVGPLRSEGLEIAARRRRDRNLVIVSPTAPENLSFERNTFSLWSTTERVTRGARALANFAVRDLQIDRFGVMYPNTQEGRSQLAAFADAARARGAVVLGSIAYDDTATTFQDPLSYLDQFHPQAIYAPASTPSSVIQLAPQFSYYGLRGVQVLGDSEWSAPEVLRLVEPRFIDGTVISTFLHRSSSLLRWQDFVEMYEREYRKGLQGNFVPALAYDATRLVLSALPWGFPRRSAIARSFREIRSMPGATGILTVESGAITRRPFILQFMDRELVPAYEALQAESASDEGEPGR
ncbi:MAG: ABC transporter substrate-binding protein [Gemmatimonadota bacterium]|nr:MAG: ABC transporter substrate-binding protein [Gemmatimonadota bacterium]